MKEIILFRGEICLVNDEDYEKIKKHKWHLDSLGYPRSLIEGTLIRMHRFIMNPPKGISIDHINGKKYDNRRENLRICTIQENARNRPHHPTNTSGYKGVSLRRDYGDSNWRAYISINKKQISLGTFKTKEGAAKAYDIKAKELFGEFARLNFPN